MGYETRGHPRYSPSVTRITAASRATVDTGILCATPTVTVSNLFPGTNWLAIATVDQIGDGTTIMALELSATANVAPALPEEPVSPLNWTLRGDGSLLFGWDGGGFTLESTTDLANNAARAPLGPWQQMPALTNPYTNGLFESSQFFRLKK